MKENTMLPSTVFGGYHKVEKNTMQEGTAQYCSLSYNWNTNTPMETLTVKI